MVNVRKLTGQVIGNYELRELYGAGGMGAVYRARQHNLERDVAFKVLALAYAAEQEFVQRFYREAKLAAGLEHPHIVPVYDYGVVDGLQYVVMRLLTGGSLAERSAQRQGVRPALGEISIVLKQLASALDYAHSQRVIHRDVKASNIMFDTHGTAYLVDFGIARLLQEDAPRLTAENAAVGTPTHMAPEQWIGQDASPLSDQYALGIVVYELLTGRVPFSGLTPYAVMQSHMNEAPLPLHEVDPNLPPSLMPVVHRALAKNPARRYPTATAFAQAFEELARRYPSPATQMFTFKLRRDLLHTDVYAPHPPPAAPSAQRTLPQPRPYPTSPQSREPQAAPRAGGTLPLNAPRTQAPPVPAATRSLPPAPPAPAAPPVVVIERAAVAPPAAPLLLPLRLIGKLFSLILGLLALIVKQAIRSTIAFIVTFILSTIFTLLVLWFAVTLFQNDMNTGLAFEAMRQQVEVWWQGISSGR